MNLINALRITYGSQCLALVGAGGKTTALFHLGRELAASTQAEGVAPVLLTTTTHLADHQVSLADVHWRIENAEDVQLMAQHLQSGLILVTGREAGSNRVAGPPASVMDALHSFARSQNIPLLIEADGSRQLPVKAPVEHEPALPSYVDRVVVVIGLSALGQPLNGQWVHRPESVKILTGLQIDEPIKAEDLKRLLLHPKGGLKGIPAGTGRTALLNQADNPELRINGEGIARSLLPVYDQALVSSLQIGDVFAAYEPLAGIVLAAGAATRFGSPKQLLPWGNEPVVCRVARTALASGLAPVVVVAGAYPEAVAQAVGSLPVQIVYNPEWAKGLSTSVRSGLESLPPQVGGVFFLLSDQPQISENLLDALTRLHAHSLPAITAPRVDSKRANPVLFDRSVFPELLVLQGDAGGRVLFQNHKAAWLDWDDPTLLLDFDTPKDYQELVRLCKP